MANGRFSYVEKGKNEQSGTPNSKLRDQLGSMEQSIEGMSLQDAFEKLSGNDIIYVFHVLAKVFGEDEANDFLNSEFKKEPERG